MNIKQLIAFIMNNYITTEVLHDVDVIGYMDIVIDDINDRMQTAFPVFSEWPLFVEAWNANHPDDLLDPAYYSAIPRNYLRSVVAPGTAVNFFTSDEEGEQVAGKNYFAYERNISKMVSDYMELVPDIYIGNTAGYITTTYPSNSEVTVNGEGVVVKHADYLL